MKLTVGSLIGAAVLIGCAPSIDADAKTDVDARVSRLRPSPIQLRAPGSDEGESMPVAPGQWAEYKITTHDGQLAFLTQQVTGEVNGAFLIEIVHDTYQGHTAEQLLVVVGDHRDPSKVVLRAVKVKDTKGRVTTLSQADLWVARNHMGPVDLYWDDAISASLVVGWKGRPQVSTVVNAGHFEGCYFTRATQPRRPQPWVVESWSHPAVPLGGLVRKQDNRGFSSELVAYGTSGARSDF